METREIVELLLEIRENSRIIKEELALIKDQCTKRGYIRNPNQLDTINRILKPGKLHIKGKIR